ncbi:hypothetical protein EJB05_20826 [Eragrostis curvula]|uniref:Uncharacterized protein n=1 Tax=Eragrostis curvula TaxID=38414 RepID=A0A5J9V1M2_9POAL|nr:hypothetical protein EJB05_20826 [Eragrostis curvula]
MDRLQRRKPTSRPHSTSLKPPRPPRGPSFQPPPASRPLPEPSSPDGRQCKKVRFANEAGSHHIGGRQVASIRESTKSKVQGGDAKTAEFKSFKKLCEQSGHRSHSYKHSHLGIEPNVSKQKQESHNATLLRKFSVQGSTVCCDDPPATPSKNVEIPTEQVNVQSSNSEYDEKDTPHLNSHDYRPRFHVVTPIAQTSFEVTGISGREPVSGQIFSEKRSKLLKLAAKTVSMGSDELLQRRSEYVGDILQRLGANNIIRKQRNGSTRHRKTECRQDPTISDGHVVNLLDYKHSDFNSLTTLENHGQPSCYASDESFGFMALPWGYNQSRLWKNDLPRGNTEALECMALPWVCTKDISSSDQNRGTVHNQVSNLLLEDVEPCILGRPASGNELSLNVRTASYDQHGWSPLLSVPLAESFRDRLSFPCQIEEQHAVPYAISNASWQPDLFSSMERCFSSSVGLGKEDPKEAGWCDNSDASFSTRFDQLLGKSTASHFLGSGNEILGHNDFRCISNFHGSGSNSMVLSSNTSRQSSMHSTPGHPYELGPMSFHDSAVGVSCSGLIEKHSGVVELSDNSDKLLRVLDQLPVLSSSPNDEPGIWDHRHLRYITSCPTEDNGNTLCLEANDPGLKSLSSYSEHPCKQDWNSFYDSSTELWSSVQQLQSHTNLGAVFDLMSNGSSYSDSEGHHSLMLVQGNLNNDILGTTDLSFFGSFSAMDNIREVPVLSALPSDGITW